MNIDITKTMPFIDHSVDLIIADLSLHYFTCELTKNIIGEISRILIKEGYLICRLNSTSNNEYKILKKNKINGIREVEKHYYYTGYYYKRFFGKDEIYNYFRNWNIKYINEVEVTKYDNKKNICWELLLKNN